MYWGACLVWFEICFVWKTRKSEMFCDQNLPPADLAYFPRLHIKRHFKRKSPVTSEDLSKLVRVVKPLSERFDSCLKDPDEREDSNNLDKEHILSRPSLSVTFAVVNDEVCRVRIREDRRPERDHGHIKNFNISRTIAVDKQLIQDHLDKLKNVMFSNRSDLANGTGLAELTSVGDSRSVLLCSNANIADTGILASEKNLGSPQVSGGCVQKSEHAQELEKNRYEVNLASSVKHETLEVDLVDQRKTVLQDFSCSCGEGPQTGPEKLLVQSVATVGMPLSGYGSLATDKDKLLTSSLPNVKLTDGEDAEFSSIKSASREKQFQDLSINHPNVTLKFPVISETVFDIFDNTSNTNLKAPNPGHSVQYSCASLVSCQAMDCIEHTAIDSYKRNTEKNYFQEGDSCSQKHATSEHIFSELTDKDDWITSFSESAELKGGSKVSSKTEHGKDVRMFYPRQLRLGQKRRQELEDEDILNEGWLELERAFKQRVGHHGNAVKRRKLEKTQLFYGRTILVGSHSHPWLIPLEDVSNEKHYKWKDDGQLVSYMKDPRLEKHVNQKKEFAEQCDLVQISFAKSTIEKVPSKSDVVGQECWTVDSHTDPIFNVTESAGADTNIKSESEVDAYESIPITSKTPNSRSCLQNYSEQLSCHRSEVIAYNTKDVTDKSISNLSHSPDIVHCKNSAFEYHPICAVGNRLENVEAGYPIPVIMSQSYISYGEGLFPCGPDDLEMDENMPPDWIDEHSQETWQKRSSCGYVNEMLRYIYSCILDARFISDDTYKDAKLIESLQCINFALNTHSDL